MPFQVGDRCGSLPPCSAPGLWTRCLHLVIAGAAYGRDPSSRTQLASTTALLDLVTTQIATEQQANICTSSQKQGTIFERRIQCAAGRKVFVIENMC